MKSFYENWSFGRAKISLQAVNLTKIIIYITDQARRRNFMKHMHKYDFMACYKMESNKNAFSSKV